MYLSFRTRFISPGLVLILVLLSLACSFTRRMPTPSKPTSTRHPPITHQPSATFTSTRTPTWTATTTTTPTSTVTFTPTPTYTHTATKTASPTSTPTSTPTKTLSPAELFLVQAETAMQSVNTIKMSISLTTKSGILPVTFIGGGVAERPDKVYIKLSFLLQNYEILSLDPNEVYVKPLGSPTWEHTPSDQMDLPTSLLSNAFGLLEVSDTAQAPILAGIENVNGVNCQRITFGIDFPLFIVRHAPAASSQIDLVTSRARGELWIGIDDHRIHKLYIEMEIVSQGETTPVKATIEFSNYNEPVDFPVIAGYSGGLYLNTTRRVNANCCITSDRTFILANSTTNAQITIYARQRNNYRSPLR